SLVLSVPDRFEGITLEAVGGATLETTTLTELIDIDGIANLTIRGFRLRATDVTVRDRGVNLIRGPGNCPGLLLGGLEAGTNRKGSYQGIYFLGSLNDAEGQPPALVRRCIFRAPRIGVAVAGSDDDLSIPRPTARVAIRDNWIENPDRVGVWMQGAL